MTQLSNGKFPYCGNAFYSIHLRSVSRLICFPSQFLSLLISLHSGGWENSRKLCKPETQSWVCITCLNSSNPHRACNQPWKVRQALFILLPNQFQGTIAQKSSDSIVNQVNKDGITSIIILKEEDNSFDIENVANLGTLGIATAFELCVFEPTCRVVFICDICTCFGPRFV